MWNAHISARATCHDSWSAGAIETLNFDRSLTLIWLRCHRNVLDCKMVCVRSWVQRIRGNLSTCCLTMAVARGREVLRVRSGRERWDAYMGGR